MTRVTICRDANDVIMGFRIEGHSGYAQSGRDVVCAAVSVLTLTAVNSVEAFTSDSFEAEVDEDKGNLYFRFNAFPSQTSQTLLNSMALGLEMIGDEYGQEYIRIRFKEV